MQLAENLTIGLMFKSCFGFAQNNKECSDNLDRP